jgi:P27 family predicted phage terminase small subunit
MKGRKPIPPEARKLLGLRSRKARKPRPDHIPGDLRCPSWLDREAKREWHRITPLLTKARILTEADQAVLAVYCSAYAEVAHCDRQMHKEGGRMTQTARGGMIVSPWARLRREAMEQLIKAANELGCTPVARCRVEPAHGQQAAEDPVAKFLSQGFKFRPTADDLATG